MILQTFNMEKGEEIVGTSRNGKGPENFKKRATPPNCHLLLLVWRILREIHNKWGQGSKVEDSFFSGPTTRRKGRCGYSRTLRILRIRERPTREVMYWDSSSMFGHSRGGGTGNKSKVTVDHREGTSS